MLHKWKSILTNWINCYSNQCMKNEDCLNLESLLTIISHLHENLSLDESKSSILEARTVEEFLLEKYPEFKFENGTVQLNGQQEVYLAASVLLYFVCVNSKDVGIKNVMCSKLCSEDQETILKFTKRLLECSPITCRDVQAAINEACGVDIAAGEASCRPKVSETPPVLRSLHGEVRRLQAALDAERFDRNYLQEELARTNLKIEKLMRDREQCKTEIAGLKAKLSSAGQEVDDRSAQGGGEGPTRLAKQLEDLEERLVATQEQLEETVYERDTYKAKVSDLKQERDKWVSASETESSRASQLLEELESERAASRSLQELVNELRQHNQRNRLDGSQLECDDADASAISLHNASVCSEACASIVEVQLSEEKAKVLALKQQVQALQDQLNDVTQKAQTEQKTFEKLLSERENDINELEQTLKETTESSRQLINQQQQDIQKLQEEKLSLIQSLSDESTKLENIIASLRNELDSEKSHKQNMKDDYENQMMKLKEKVLNRNNELVELQDNICQKSEMIEQLHLDLRNEKKSKEEVVVQCSNDIAQLNDQIKTIENELKQKTDEANELQRRLSQNVAIFTEMNREIDDLKLANEELDKNCKQINDAKVSLTTQLRERDAKLEEMEKCNEDLKTLYEEEKTNLVYTLDEKVATVNTLQMQLHAEIQYKSGLENELGHLRQARSSLSDEVNKLNSEIAVLKSENMDQERKIYALDLYLKEEKHSNKTTKQECDKLNEDLKKISDELMQKKAELEEMISQKEAEIQELQNTLKFEKTSATEEILRKDEFIKSIDSELQTTKAQKEDLESKFTMLLEEKDKLAIDISKKNENLQILKSDLNKLTQISEKNVKDISKNLEEQSQKYGLLQKAFDEHTSQLMAKLNKKERIFKELYSKLLNTLKEKELVAERLHIKVEALENIIRNERESLTKLEKEKCALIEKLDSEKKYKSNFEKEYQNQCSMLDKVTAQMNSVIVSKTEEIEILKKDVDILKADVAQKTEDYLLMTMKLSEKAQAIENIVNLKSFEIEELRKEILQLNSLNIELDKELKKEVETKLQAIEALQRENVQLLFTIEEDNSNHEVIVKEKDTMIERLEEHLNVMTISLETIRKEYEDATYVWETSIVENQKQIKLRNEHIRELKKQVDNVNHALDSAKGAASQLKQELVGDIQTVSKDITTGFKIHEAAQFAEFKKLKNRIMHLEQENNNLRFMLETEKGERDSLENENNKLIKENESLLEELYREQSAYTAIYGDKNELLNEKSVLSQELVEEKSMRQLSENEKQTLLSEKEMLADQLQHEISMKNIIIDEKEILTQQIIEEKSIKEIMEKQKDSLENKVRELEQEKLELGMQKVACVQELQEKLETEITANDNLQKEISKLNKLFDVEKESKNVLYEEKESLLSENQTLKNKVLELITIKDVILHDKEILEMGKENLIKSLNEEKSVRDEMESEKNKLTDTLKDMTEKYNLDLNQKQEELQSIVVELKAVKTDFKKLEETNAQLALALNTGLEKLLQNIKKEGIDNEVLQKLIDLDNLEGLCLEAKCDLLVNVADTLTSELALRTNLENALKHESTAVKEMQEMFKAKEMQALELQAELKVLQQSLQEMKIEQSKQIENYNSILEMKSQEIHKLHADNKSLTNELNDVKVQLEVKVHSLKEKLIDNENVTDKLKKTYECQIENLNVMVTKLTNYLKEKTIEIDAARKEKDRLQQMVDDSVRVIESLQYDLKIEQQNKEKLLSEFDSERLVLKNMITVTESVMEDNKCSLNQVIAEHTKTNENLQHEIKALEVQLEAERNDAGVKIKEKEISFETAFRELSQLRKEKELQEEEARKEIQSLNNQILSLEDDLMTKESYSEAVVEENKNLNANCEKLMQQLEEQTGNFMEEVRKLSQTLAEKEACLELLEQQNNELTDALGKLREDINYLEQKDSDLQIKKTCLESELLGQLENLTLVLKGEASKKETPKSSPASKKSEIQSRIKILSEDIIELVKENNNYITKMGELQRDMEAKEIAYQEDLNKLTSENVQLRNRVEENKAVITNLEQLSKHGLEETEKARELTANENFNLQNKCTMLQEYQSKAEKQLLENEEEIAALKKEQEMLKSELCVEIETHKLKLEAFEFDVKKKEEIINRITKEKEEIENMLEEEKGLKEKYENELASKGKALGQQIEELLDKVQVLEVCKKENEQLVKAIGERETFAATSQDKVSSHRQDIEKERHQVSSSNSDITHSSMESLKTISDLEKIILDKNRTITNLQSDITYMKSLVADSENQLLDVKKELESTKEHCEQLSCQLKNIVHQKNDDIADLKRQVSKMSVTENRATQIIKVSAKYQAIILKRIAEIKSNTILKELTNFGNAANCDSELKRSLNSGSITMEDLENFLETTDRHLKRCSEKQIALQKDRDRLAEVNRINESEIINLKKFLTELSVSFKTFSSVKEIYAQKLTKVVSLQRNVRREILNLDGHITDVTMCKLERGYAAVIQDLCECAMNLERWVERCIGRTISPEKIKQAFLSDTERNSLNTTSFLNASLEVQLDELEKSFQKLLEEVSRAPKEEGARDPQAVTVMEVRAEYEDKLNRMKAKMKQLYQEQISVFKEKQKEEIAVIERELEKAKDKLAESSRAYEEHIRSLTNELWNVGEKYLMKKDEAEWLRRKEKSGSLMSLQHVHSSGLTGHPERPPRPSDTHSLRSLPVAARNHPNEKRENRGLHMSDEEGEVFDNRCLRELATPRRESTAPLAPADPGARLSELRWRNSLCPPHLKSSYPAETQFALVIDEEDIKAQAAGSAGPRASAVAAVRKEVGITAYKKPGPPTPSKQAGRLSATDCELRESLRVDSSPAPSTLRRAGTPSRLRALFARQRHDDGTPRRRFSNIFGKK